MPRRAARPPNKLAAAGAATRRQAAGRSQCGDDPTASRGGTNTAHGVHSSGGNDNTGKQPETSAWWAKTPAQRQGTHVHAQTTTHTHRGRHLEPQFTHKSCRRLGGGMQAAGGMTRWACPCAAMFTASGCSGTRRQCTHQVQAMGWVQAAGARAPHVGAAAAAGRPAHTHADSKDIFT